MKGKRNKIIDLTPSITSPPSSSPDLQLLYGALSEDNKRIFLKIYKYLWGVVCPASRFIRFSGVLYSYWIVDYLRRQYNLTVTDLCLLSLIYHLTNNGRKTLKSSIIYDNLMTVDIKRYSIKDDLVLLKQRGYITRLRRNPDNKYLTGSSRSHPVFVRLTVEGVQLIENIERDLHNILFRTSLDDLKGINKRGK